MDFSCIQCHRRFSRKEHLDRHNLTRTVTQKTMVYHESDDSQTAKRSHLLANTVARASHVATCFRNTFGHTTLSPLFLKERAGTVLLRATTATIGRSNASSRSPAADASLLVWFVITGDRSMLAIVSRCRILTASQTSPGVILPLIVMTSTVKAW